MFESFCFSILKKALIGHLKKLPTINNDPSLLYTLPLLHLLCGLCNPFEELKEDLTHGAPTPVWWGTAEVDQAAVRLLVDYQWSMYVYLSSSCILFS